MAVTRLGFAGPSSAYAGFGDKAEQVDVSQAGYAGWQSSVAMACSLLLCLVSRWR